MFRVLFAWFQNKNKKKMWHDLSSQLVFALQGPDDNPSENHPRHYIIDGRPREQFVLELPPLYEVYFNFSKSFSKK